jgi:hypothetical protein
VCVCVPPFVDLFLGEVEHSAQNGGRAFQLSRGKSSSSSSRSTNLAGFTHEECSSSWRIIYIAGITGRKRITETAVEQKPNHHIFPSAKKLAGGQVKRRDQIGQKKQENGALAPL